MPAKKKAVAKIKSEPKKLLYTAVLKVMGRTAKSEGSSVIEAIAGLKSLGTRGTVSILTVSYGEKTREKILNRAQTNRLFTLSRLMREVALKNVSALFDL